MIFKELFYLLFSVLRKIELASTPALSAYLLVCMIISLNVISVFIVVLHLLDISLIDKNIDTLFWGILYGAIIMTVNYFTLYSKREIIFEEYRQRHTKRKIIGAIVGVIYIVLSYIVFQVIAKAFLPS